MDAPLEPLLKLNNVKDNLPMEKSFLNLRLSYVLTGFKRGDGTKIFKGGKVKRGCLIIILKRGYVLKKGALLKGEAETTLQTMTW